LTSHLAVPVVMDVRTSPRRRTGSLSRKRQHNVIRTAGAALQRSRSAARWPQPGSQGLVTP
jgi:hypothetical protein